MGLTSERVMGEVVKALASAKPSRFFVVLRDCGALAVVLPEVSALVGVPQPAAHHPEGDAFTHVMMALDVAAAAGFDLDVRFAVLCHDFGKARTPADVLPSHVGHDVAGAPVALAFANRLNAPAAFRDLAVLVAAQHTRVHRAADMGAGAFMDLFKAADAFRRPDRLNKLVQAVQADSQGRGGNAGSQPFPQAAVVAGAFAAAMSVDVPAVLAKAKARAVAAGKDFDPRVTVVNARTMAVAAFVKARKQAA